MWVLVVRHSQGHLRTHAAQQTTCAAVYQRRRSLNLIVGPAIRRPGFALDIAGILEALAESAHRLYERPNNNRAADKGDEIAPVPSSLQSHVANLDCRRSRRLSRTRRAYFPHRGSPDDI